MTRLPTLLVPLLLLACGNDPAVEPANPRTPAKPVEPLGLLGDHHVIYIPAYSHVVHGQDNPRTFQLTATLSVHNISFRDSIWVHKVRYYDTEGRLVEEFLRQSIGLHPMETYQVSVAPRDTSGLGANFLVEWEGADGVPAPIAEAVHVGVSTTTGLSFVTRGTPLRPNVVPEDFSP